MMHKRMRKLKRLSKIHLESVKVEPQAATAADIIAAAQGEFWEGVGRVAKATQLCKQLHIGSSFPAVVVPSHPPPPPPPFFFLSYSLSRFHTLTGCAPALQTRGVFAACTALDLSASVILCSETHERMGNTASQTPGTDTCRYEGGKKERQIYSHLHAEWENCVY